MRQILVLDSGIGGMTIVRAMRALDMELAITFISDNAQFPYGRLQAATIAARMHQLVGEALARAPYDAAVIACNTASTAVMQVLRDAYDIPFVGVVPAIKTAARLSKSRVIGLLATEATVRRRYIDQLIKDFAADCQVVRVGSPDLAGLAEDKARGRPVDTQRLRTSVAAFAAYKDLDVVALGCTHYPILSEELQCLLGPQIRLLDPALPVARRLQSVLERGGHPPTGSQSTGRDQVFFTGCQALPEDLRPFLRGLGFQHLNHWPADRAIDRDRFQAAG